MPENRLTATLLLTCPDRKGLVSLVSNFIFERGGNILDLVEHVNAEEQRFFLRVAWDMKEFSVSPEHLTEAFLPMAREFEAEWSIRLNRTRHRLAIFVSKYDHCLQEILWRHDLGEFDAEIALVISNHPDLGYLAERYRLPFYVFPISQENKAAQENEELALLNKNNVDTIILARYMQVLSPAFLQKYPNRILNIHHSFLPAFAGRNPYNRCTKGASRSSARRATTSPKSSTRALLSNKTLSGFRTKIPWKTWYEKEETSRGWCLPEECVCICRIGFLCMAGRRLCLNNVTAARP